MPFKSKSQQKFMYAKHPGIAKKWDEEYGTKNKKMSLNERIKKAKKK